MSSSSRLAWLLLSLSVVTGAAATQPPAMTPVRIPPPLSLSLLPPPPYRLDSGVVPPAAVLRDAEPAPIDEREPMNGRSRGAEPGAGGPSP